MRYAGIIRDDTSAAPGLSLSFFVQGCPIRCQGCHNPQTWDQNGGYEFTQDTLNRVLLALNANGILRKLCIMGGEPLAPYNIELTKLLISKAKETYPEISIYLWTGYTLEDLRSVGNHEIKEILDKIDCLIDGPFILDERDITLKMRGSKNQRIWLAADLRK